MKVLRILLTLAMILSIPSISFAYTNPVDLPESWEWNSGEYYGEGDPYILKYNGTYYLYVSTVDDKSGVKAWTSEDLMSWEYQGLVTEEPSTKAAYAPEVTYWNGAFYMYTSPGGNGHYVYKSTSPLGPFEKQTENLGMGIDGHIFIDDDGKWYFYGTGDNYISAHEMDDPYTFGPKINTGAEMKGWTEGATVFKRNEKYYMTYTGNHIWSNAYRIDYGVSDSPTGKFEAQTSPLLINTEGSNVGLGHNTIVRGPDLDSDFIVYHSHAKPGRSLNFDRLGWNGDKMVVFGPTTFEQPNPSLPDFDDRFTRDDIGSEWKTINGGAWSIVDNALKQEELGDSTWHRQVTTYETAADYTAEFNATLIDKGDSEKPRYGALFSYQDEDNYGMAVLNPTEDTLETFFRVNGKDQEWETSTLPDDFDHEHLHQIRVEKKDSEFKIFVDGMQKQTRQVNELAGGKIGYTTSDVQAAFGYVATSNHVNGSNVFDLYKPLPGKIEAVHYNAGGEGVGYHSTAKDENNNYRTDAVDIKANPEGGYSVNSFEKGEWLNYNVNVEEDGTYTINMRVASAQEGAKIKLLLDDDTELTGIVEVPHTGGEDQWQNMVIDKVSLPKGEHTIKVEVVNEEFNFASFELSKQKDVSILFDDFNDGLDTGWDRFEGNWRVDTNTDSASVFDSYKPLPGEIQAAYYNNGGEGVGYHDRTAENIGGLLRTDSVDIREKPGGGTVVGWNQTGEWLKYNVNIQEKGLYNAEIELSTTFTDGQVRLWLDDDTDLTGIVNVPSTGEWNNWQTLNIDDVELPEGEHTLKLEIVKGEYDISKLTFRSFDIHKPLPGTIEAVDYNLGGEGIAYHDQTEANTGGEFREDGVDIKKDPTGRFAVDSFEQGEWLSYNVGVSEAGEYDLDLVTSNSDESTQIRLWLNDEIDLTGVVDLPITEGQWANIPIQNLNLPQGKHTLKIEVVNGNSSFSKMILHTFDQDHSLPGKILAVDYMTGGEGVAYHDKTPSNIGGKYRNDSVDIRHHPSGTYNIGWNQAGEWVKYNTNIVTSGEYVLDMSVTTDVQGSQVRLWLDDEIDLTGVIDVPQTGGWDNWTSLIKEGITLPAGNHTIKVETVSGEFDFHSFSLHEKDEFEVVEPEGVYRSGAGTFGKATIGDTAWTDYIVEADIQVVNGEGDGGILFRVNNPVHGKELNHNSADMLQGYVAYINKDGLHLGKFNYNWSLLKSVKLNEPIDEWQHMKIVLNGMNIKVYVGDMDKPKIDYTDHSPTAFTHGKIGVRSFLSDTKYDNISVRPEPSFDSTKELIDEFNDSGDIDHSLYTLLQNKLKQAQHQMDKGNKIMSTKHLNDMLSHLTKQKEKITELANQKISEDISYLVNK